MEEKQDTRITAPLSMHATSNTVNTPMTVTAADTCDEHTSVQVADTECHPREKTVNTKRDVHPTITITKVSDLEHISQALNDKG